MHVTIVQLTTAPTDYKPPEDDVCADNYDKFPDGVEERYGADRQRDVAALLAWLGDAARTGIESVNGKNARWIEIDRNKAVDLYRPYFERYLDIVRSLHHHDITDFATGGHGLGEAIRRLQTAYEFDKSSAAA